MDDLISRQAAIDFVDAGHLVSPSELRWSDNDVVNFLKRRPSAHDHLWFQIGEVLVEESKMHISAEQAVEKIRQYMHEADFKREKMEVEHEVD